MKLLHFRKNNQLSLGIKTNRGVLDIEAALKKWEEPALKDVHHVIEQGADGITALTALVGRAEEESSDELFLTEDGMGFGPAVPRPQKIICVGLNYVSHAEESKMQIPGSPILFSKFNNALAAHEEDVHLPEDADQFDYEAELVIVMGKQAKNVSEDDALSHVFGYSVGNDISARDLQFRTGQWLLGKTSDKFAPIGPYLVTADEVDPTNLDVECRVNGELRQSANTKDMIFSSTTLISYISRYMTLEPGDVIFSGTPEGVILGYSEENQHWLSAGDEIVVSIEGLGTLRNTLR